MESSKVASAVLVVLWLHSVTSQTMSESTDLTFACPPWFIPTLQANGTVTCTCGSEIEDIVRCDQGNLQATLRFGNCMTFDTETNETFVGSCPLSQAKNSTMSLIHLPRNLSDLNEFMCDQYNREGRLCGRCKPGYSSTILTYGRPCVNCTGKESTSWMVFLYSHHNNSSDSVLHCVSVLCRCECPISVFECIRSLCTAGNDTW